VDPQTSDLLSRLESWLTTAKVLGRCGERLLRRLQAGSPLQVSEGNTELSGHQLADIYTARRNIMRARERGEMRGPVWKGMDEFVDALEAVRGERVLVHSFSDETHHYVVAERAAGRELLGVICGPVADATD
jgi:hypothetical protein